MAIDAKTINIHMQVTGPFAAQMAANGAAVQTFGNQAHAGMAKAHTGMAKFGAVASKVGAISAIAIAGGLLLSAKAAITFESSFAGVRKTVEASEPEFQRLAMGIRQMAREIPIGVNELNRIAELGGQLGVDAGGLLEFTETIAKIGVTTTLSTEQAAISFARLDNIMGENQQSFEAMGSSVVELGNNFAATEDEIITFATRIAPVGATLGVTTDEVLAIATAFTSVGIPAERGGTAVQKTFIAIADAAKQGGIELAVFAEVAGTTEEGFARLVATDPARAFEAFVLGLGRIEAEGGNVFSVLDSLHLGNQRVVGSLLALANAEGVLTEALGLGREAWDEQTALTEEAEKRFETTASQLIILKNRVIDFGIGIGQEVLPVFNDFLTGIATLGTWFANLPGWVKVGTVAVLGLTAAFWALTAHPIIAALAVVAGGIALIGKSAREAKDQADGLRKVLEDPYSIKTTPNETLDQILGGDNFDILRAAGFSPKDIDRAIRGTDAEFDRFFDAAQNKLNLRASTLKDEYGGVVTPALYQDKRFKGLDTAISEVEQQRENLAGLRYEYALLDQETKRARIFGLDYPGRQADDDALARRIKLMNDLRNARLGIESTSPGEDLLKPAFLDDDALGDINEALFDYEERISESFKDIDAELRGHIDGWYEFDDDLEIAWSEIIDTLSRQITAVAGFEETLRDLDLRPDVEAWVRDTFNNPALMEAFVNFRETGGQEFTDFVDGVIIQLDRLNDAVYQKFINELPVIEFESGQQFLDDIGAVTKEILDDPENIYDPLQVWYAVMLASLNNAPTDEIREKILGVLNSALADPAFRDELGLTVDQIELLIATLNSIPGLIRTKVEVEFPYIPEDFQDWYDPPEWNKGLPTPEHRAFGGSLMAGQMSIVGEHGPELFVPFVSGTIVPNSKLGGETKQITVQIIRPETNDLPGDISEGLTRASIAEQVDLIGVY